MTTEEKAKAYDEAIERAKRLESPFYKQAAEIIFPELAESEDEMIRKQLIKKVQKYIDGNIPCSYDPHKVLAWLERQKEQKLVTFNEPYNSDEYEVVEVGNATCLRRKEQKLTKWSEEYQEEDLRTRFAFYTYKDEDDTLYLSNLFVEEASRNKGFGTKILEAAEKVAEAIGASRICLRVKQDSPSNVWYHKHGYEYMTFEDGYDWLEKNLEYMKSNKQEWNEKDEQIINTIINHFKVDLECTDEDDIIVWLKDLQYRLKALRPPLKDKDMKLKILKYLSTRCSSLEFEEVEDYLNNLRPQPHWEPTEEQMDALKNAAFGAVTNGDGPYLRQLYNELKKL